MRSDQNKMLSNLAGLFFISGFSALIYQVCWQRLLFTGFGVDLTSITIIISVFMLGLGIGAFWGGRLADIYSDRIILIFTLIELGIGIFGLVSKNLIILLQTLLLDSSQVTMAIFSFLLLLFPTFLMGMTLPLLTSFFNRYIQNIGSSIGGLYFFNTLGASLGALSTGFIFFNYMTLSQTIFIASSLNVFIAFCIYSTYGIKKNEA